jgi:hypothetical protein
MDKCQARNAVPPGCQEVCNKSKLSSSVLPRLVMPRRKDGGGTQTCGTVGEILLAVVIQAPRNPLHGIRPREDGRVQRAASAESMWQAGWVPC